MLTPESRRLRARIAATLRHHPTADVSGLQAELIADRIVADVARHAPLLTPTQRARIEAALLGGSTTRLCPDCGFARASIPVPDGPCGAGHGAGPTDRVEWSDELLAEALRDEQSHHLDELIASLQDTDSHGPRSPGGRTRRRRKRDGDASPGGQVEAVSGA